MTRVTRVAARDVADVQEAVRAGRVLPVAGASKPALSGPVDGLDALDVSGLTGIVDYDPGELTLTARAGTPLAEVTSALAQHGQRLPFDPPLVAAGATVGGAVAAGVAGPGALRHGGVRDFVIAVRCVDGTGRLVSGGAKVVKNAAGFDLPKLMVGALGRLGVLVEVSFKVFPAPRATVTVVAELDPADPAAAPALVRAALRSPAELEALDIANGQALLRLGGTPETLVDRAQRLIAALPVAASVVEDDEVIWHAAAELTWVDADRPLVRVATTIHTAPVVIAAGAQMGAVSRLSLAGNAVWVAPSGPQQVAALDAQLGELGLRGVALRGTDPTSALLGAGAQGGAFGQRVRSALDPDQRFLEL